MVRRPLGNPKALAVDVAVPEIRCVPPVSPGVLGLDLDQIRDKNYLTHNFHPYPAKFIPQIPKAIIDRYSQPGDVVLDPFCGCGTSLVEAALAGRVSYGSDINPIACMVSRAKTANITRDELQALEDLTDKLKRESVEPLTPDKLEMVRASIPVFRNRDHWFQSDVQIELARILRHIRQANLGCAEDIALTAFSAILVRVSNQESETRWVSTMKHIKVDRIVDIYVTKLLDMTARTIAFSKLAKSSAYVYQSNAVRLDYLGDASVSLVVTSPPYLSSFDYYLYHKLRFFWLGFDQKVAQEAEIGSRNKHCDLSQGVETYIQAMTSCFRECHRVLRPEGRLAIVVGDAIHDGQLVAMGPIFQVLASSVGFRTDLTVAYEQRRYSSSFPRFAQLKSQAKKMSHILVFGKTTKYRRSYAVPNL